MPVIPPLCAMLAWAVAAAPATSPARPFFDRLVWLPMTGVTPDQMSDARAAGYDTMLIKVAPPFSEDGRLDTGGVDAQIAQAAEHGLDAILVNLGWVGLPRERFYDVEENGTRIPGRLDPFDPQAMRRIEQYHAAVIERYAADPRVAAFVPTWGIYGEAGFTSLTAGRSPRALARFNEWRAEQGLPALGALPTLAGGPNSEFNRFARFRFVYLQARFDEMFRRLKPRAGGKPVGSWQEMYSVIGWGWTMVRVPSADFALGEATFPYQAGHDPEHTLAEAMGFRYRCDSPEAFRNYILPVLARKRGEGQRFMGCQLSEGYAVKQYGWTPEQAARVQFERWEDLAAPALGALNRLPIERPQRDVLLVCPTYAGAAVEALPVHHVDAWLWDVTLRMYGCQMVRAGSPRLDEMSVEEFDRFRLIVIPTAAHVLSSTLERLGRSRARVVFAGQFGRVLDGAQAAPGESRAVNGWSTRHGERPAGEVEITWPQAPRRPERHLPASMPADQAFEFGLDAGMEVLASCAGRPLISRARDGRTMFFHGQVLAGLCHDPRRQPPSLAGSVDASANEVDMWGPYSSSHRQNALATALVGAVLDWANVEYRIPRPPPRTLAPLLGDNLEAGGISANLVYNNTAAPLELDLRLPWRPAGEGFHLQDGRHSGRVRIPAFAYVALSGWPGE